MSRSRKGSKSPGKEWNSKRPGINCVPGRVDKKITHQIERAKTREEIDRDLKELDEVWPTPKVDK